MNIPKQSLLGLYHTHNTMKILRVDVKPLFYYFSLMFACIHSFFLLVFDEKKVVHNHIV